MTNSYNQLLEKQALSEVEIETHKHLKEELQRTKDKLRDMEVDIAINSERRNVRKISSNNNNTCVSLPADTRIVGEIINRVEVRGGINLRLWKSD